jgi:hypothetical protein
MPTLRTKVKGEAVTVELTVEELHELLDLQRKGRIPGTGRGGRQSRPMPARSVRASPRATPTLNLALAIREAWPSGMDLVDKPELTSGNVRRFLIQRVLAGAPSVSTVEVCERFFGRQLSPVDPEDAALLRKVWYCVRQAKRDIEEAVGGSWQDSTDVPLRAGTSRSWRYVPDMPVDETRETIAYRERAR